MDNPDEAEDKQIRAYIQNNMSIESVDLTARLRDVNLKKYIAILLHAAATGISGAGGLEELAKEAISAGCDFVANVHPIVSLPAVDMPGLKLNANGAGSAVGATIQYAGTGFKLK